MVSCAIWVGARKKPFIDSLKLSSLVGSALKHNQWFFQYLLICFSFISQYSQIWFQLIYPAPLYPLMHLISQCKLTWEFSNFFPITMADIQRQKSSWNIRAERPLWDNLSSLFDRWRKWGKVICPWAQGQIRLTDWMRIRFSVSYPSILCTALWSC